jgi:DNA-binding NarL/FixJ family response regulator
MLAEAGLAGEHASAIYERGALTRRSGHDREAREHLRRALEAATGIGAGALARRCRAELSAAGARPRREALSGPSSLTPAEERVADGAARGLTNQGIAGELFISVKTVEMHLSSVYRKLNITGRKDLAAALAED